MAADPGSDSLSVPLLTTETYTEFTDTEFTLLLTPVSSGQTPPVSSGLTPALSSGQTPPVSSGLTPVSSSLTPVSSGLTHVSSSLTPVSSSLTPVSSGLTPALSSGQTPPVSSGLTPVSSGLTHVSSSLTPVSSGLTPVSSGLTPVSSGLTPVSSGLTPVSSGLTPVSSGLTPVSSSLTPAVSSSSQKRRLTRNKVAINGSYRGVGAVAPLLWMTSSHLPTMSKSRALETLSDANIKRVVESLEKEIIDLESVSQADPQKIASLKEKRQELNSFMQERAKGALVRARFTKLQDIDTPTAFFFSLEKSVVKRKQMLCLRLPEGKVTTEPAEMRKHAVDFYTDLFKADECAVDSAAELLQGLPQLSSEEQNTLSSELTFDELTAAVSQMA
ncbi:hypothetical protein JOQ06_009254, partial [Pogonophryne albipinna]